MIHHTNFNIHEMGKIAQDQSTNNEIGAGNLIDAFARTISYLRLSLTDKCNLRCIYCTPQGSKYKRTSSELLSYEELIHITSLAVELGIRKVRLTGGEPLLRRDLDYFIKNLTSIPDLDDVRLTTNGVLLGDYAQRLYDSGIKKINISLDTLSKEKYQKITGSEKFEQVWESLEKILSYDFFKVKLNIVALQGINDNEFADFARLALTHGLQIRFIEYMPMGRSSAWNMDSYVSSSVIREMIRREVGELVPLDPEVMEGPATIYRLVSNKEAGKKEGRIGFISPISHKFCESCNRLRLTARGGLRSCLLSDEEIDLKKILRSGASDQEIKDILTKTIKNKPKGHNLISGQNKNCHGEMSRIGG